MKTITKLIVLAALPLMFAVTVRGQVTESAHTEATIITTISLENQTELNFGNLAVTALGGVVTLEPSAAATRSQVGGVTFPIIPGTVTAARFLVQGLPSSTYSITLPTTDLTITNTTGSGGETMIVNNFTSTPTPTGTLNLSGDEIIYVGADVLVLAGQEPGVYRSIVPFDVTVNYN